MGAWIMGAYQSRWCAPFIVVTGDPMIIPKEYQDADIVVMPSLYEGFGAMVIEAQATGRPVITTNREPMRSISNGAAYLMNNPLDDKEMKMAIDMIVNDDDYRNRLIEAGLNNASNYSLANCAKEHINLYKKI